MRLTMPIFAIVLLLSFANHAAAQGSLKLSEPGWDFGKREQTETDTKVIKVTNTGPRAIRITKVELTCGCVQAKLAKLTIQPSECVDMNLKLFANRGEGEVKKYVILHTNDPKQAKYRLPMTGTIRPIWTLDVKGRLLDFGEIKNGAPVTKRVTMRVRPEFKIELVEILSQPMGNKIQIKRTPFHEQDGHYGWYLDLTLSGALANGDFEGVVRVETDFAKFRFRGFRILARVVSTTSISPKVLRLGTLDEGTIWQGRIDITKAVGRGLRLISASSKDPRVAISSSDVEKGQHIRLDVSITPKATDADVRGKILIVVDEPGYRNFEVTYRGRVQHKAHK